MQGHHVMIFFLNQIKIEKNILGAQTPQRKSDFPVYRITG
jgi:hypothetical protein